MADVHSKKTRSYNMSQIRSADTGPEIKVRKFLHGNGFRYRLHTKELPGKPDLVLKKYRTVVFVNGCFWHGHTECRYFKIPQTRKEWWTQKLGKNAEKDMQNTALLRKEKWKVITVWECDLRPPKTDITLRKLLKQILKYKI